MQGIETRLIRTWTWLNCHALPKRPASRQALWILILVLSVVGALYTRPGYLRQKEAQAWHTASAADTEAAWTSYIEGYPNTERRAKIKLAHCKARTAIKNAGSEQEQMTIVLNFLSTWGSDDYINVIPGDIPKETLSKRETFLQVPATIIHNRLKRALCGIPTDPSIVNVAFIDQHLKYLRQHKLTACSDFRDYFIGVSGRIDCLLLLHDWHMPEDTKRPDWLPADVERPEHFLNAFSKQSGRIPIDLSDLKLFNMTGSPPPLLLKRLRKEDILESQQYWPPGSRNSSEPFTVNRLQITDQYVLQHKNIVLWQKTVTRQYDKGFPVKIPFSQLTPYLGHLEPTMPSLAEILTWIIEAQTLDPVTNDLTAYLPSDASYYNLLSQLLISPSRRAFMDLWELSQTALPAAKRAQRFLQGDQI